MSDPERRLEFFLLIPWVKTGDDELPKMFKGIIPKEYRLYRRCGDITTGSNKEFGG